MLRDYVLPGGSLDWSVFQCPTCKSNFVGHAAFSDHVAAKSCKPTKGKVNSRPDLIPEVK
jgi:hypothetical protein